MKASLSFMFTFQRGYFGAALVFFLIEVLIALFVTDRIIRPYVGDYLVVMLIYCAIKAIINASPPKTALGVLLFAYIIEWLQYLDLLTHLGLKNNTLASVVLGSSFEWIDMLAYTLGIATVIGVEALRTRQRKKVTTAKESAQKKSEGAPVCVAD